MRQQLIDLNEIQKIDLCVREVEKRREAIPKVLQELEASVHALQTEAQSLTEQRLALDKEIKVLAGNIHTETHKLRKWEARLGDIRNQREYLALSREVEASKRTNRESEERIQELNKQKIVIDQQMEALQDKLGVVGIDCEEERKRVNAQLAVIDAEIAAERARRDALCPGIPAALLRKYESIRAKRFGMGLALVTDGSCVGCNMRLPPQLFNVLQRMNSMEQCPSCQRIIFWDRMLPQVDGAVAEQGTSGPTATPASLS